MTTDRSKPGEGVTEGIIAAADWVRDRRFTHEEEHGYIEPDTGALSYGTGPRAHAKEEYNAELAEIEEGLRELAVDRARRDAATAESGAFRAVTLRDAKDFLRRLNAITIGDPVGWQILAVLNAIGAHVPSAQVSALSPENAPSGERG